MAAERDFVHSIACVAFVTADTGEQRYAMTAAQKDDGRVKGDIAGARKRETEAHVVEPEASSSWPTSGKLRPSLRCRLYLRVQLYFF